jgi:pimeloyl-ACP methyl ester carboxylesterase
MLAFLPIVAACSQTGHPPMPEALVFLQSDNAVLYQEVTVPEWDGDSYHVFQPRAAAPTRGFIFYGGSSVDPRGYAPSAHDIAAAGYMMVLVSVPLDMALLAPERAGVVIEAFPEITTWAIGGHSMGGIAACAYAKDNLDVIDAVILWASYPSEENSLADTGMPALVISASEDGIYPPDVIDDARKDLPPDTVYVEIQGGNHFQFGWYLDDHQPVDGEATITREEQTARIVDATVDFLSALQ